MKSCVKKIVFSRKYWPILIGLLCCILYIGEVNAETRAQCLDAETGTQNTVKSAILGNSCPIGNGVWGALHSTSPDDSFWIQCGLLPNPLTQEKLTALQTKLNTSVWFKLESTEYRCLLGPYRSAKKVSSALQQVKTIVGYKKAFIRIVHSKQAVTAKSKYIQTNQPISNAQKNRAKQSQKLSPQELPQLVKPLPTHVVLKQGKLDVRLQATVGGYRFAVPYLVGNNHQFYMEYAKPWSRLNYLQATKTCQQLEMKVVNKRAFEVLKKSGVMQAKHWPTQLPYWGNSEIGLFMSHTTGKLSDSTLLNVMCFRAN